MKRHVVVLACLVCAAVYVWLAPFNAPIFFTLGGLAVVALVFYIRHLLALQNTKEEE